MKGMIFYTTIWWNTEQTEKLAEAGGLLSSPPASASFFLRLVI
jgi:hypothetical protein